MLRAGARIIAFGAVAIGVSLGAARLSPPAPQETALRLSPSEVFPLQEVAIPGLPDDVMGLGLRAVPLDAAGKESGAAIALHAVRLEAGVPVFTAPPHPAGFDKNSRFRIELDGQFADERLILTVKALPESTGQTLAVLADLRQAVEAMARSGGGDLGQLHDGPIEEVPLHLFGAALGLRVIDETEAGLRDEELVWTDRWLAARGIGDALSDFADGLATLPEFPPVEPGDRETKPAGRGAEEDGPGLGARAPAASPVQFASATLPHPSVTMRARSVHPPWAKVDICSECPGTLDYWMSLQSELEQGYGNLLERMARDRDLFDFTESLKGEPPDAETRAMDEALSLAYEQARESADNTFKNLLTPRAKRGLSWLALVKGVFELTIGINDKYLVGLLPSELLPASVRLTPARFNEDDRRAEPTEGVGTWHLRVTARSKAEVVFTVQDLIKFFSDLKSIASAADASVFEDGNEKTRTGFCVEGGSVGEKAPVGTGEAACKRFGEVIDRASKTADYYEKARRGLEAQDRRGAANTDDPPKLAFEPIDAGPFAWPRINVSDPKWSTARPLEGCVRVVKRPRAGRGVPWTAMTYSPDDPESWGDVADVGNAAEIGIKPAEVGDCDVRISTRMDRFGDAAPVHLDVPTGVDDITVQVDPSPITVVSGDTVVFEPTVRYADSVDVDWSAAEGSGELVNCDSDVNGRPCYEWIAPVLEENECRRPVPVTATSIVRRGLRADGEPVRDGDAAVVVKDPAADLAITYRDSEVSQITLEPEQDALLVATGEAAGESEIRWEASAGRIGRTGRRTTYDPPDDPGTYRVTASTEESQHCAPVISVIVVGDSPCHWSASISGLPGNAGAAGLRGRAHYVDSYGPPLQIRAMVQEGDPQPEAPWLTIQLDDRDPGGGMPGMAELEELTAIDLAIPGIRPGETGSWQRVWGKLNVGFESYPGNAEYLRRDLVGLPEGSGIGYLLTTNVTLKRHDDERVEGTFDARFLDLSRVPEEDRRPLGVGVHSLPEGEIRVSGEFSVLLGAACKRTSGP